MNASRFDSAALGDYVSFKTGKLDSNAAVPGGTYPFFTCSRETLRTNTFAFDGEAVLLAGNNANGVYPIKYYEGKFDAYQRTYVIRSLDKSRLDNRYLFYALTPLLSRLQALSTGAATKFLTLGILKGLPLPLPTLLVQRRIADILSAYDDLIENNTKRINLLEETVRSLYREWFVNFRFPGHEKVKMVSSALGRVPQGWEVVPVSAAVELNPKTAVPKEGDKPFVSMNALSNDSMLIDSVELRDGNSGSKFKNGDTLFARITPCLENGKTGYVQFLEGDEAVAFGSTEFVVMRERSFTREMNYLLAREPAFREHAIKSMSGASGRQRVQEKCFDTFLVAVGPVSIRTRFTETVRPMFRQVHVLALANQKLRETRDLLLPRLVSGEVAVDAAGQDDDLGSRGLRPLPNRSDGRNSRGS